MWKLLLDAHPEINTWSFVVGCLGVVVSGFGVYYALRALQKATGAEGAAKEATRAANRRSAQDELVLIARVGDDLIRSLEDSDWGRATDCSRQLRLLLGEFEGQHRGSDLFEETEFATIAEHIQSVHEECVKIRRDTSKATDGKRDKVHGKAGEAVERLARLLGKLRKPHLPSGG